MVWKTVAVIRNEIEEIAAGEREDQMVTQVGDSLAIKIKSDNRRFSAAYPGTRFRPTPRFGEHGGHIETSAEIDPQRPAGLQVYPRHD